jgi:hypothetical protein
MVTYCLLSLDSSTMVEDGSFWLPVSFTNSTCLAKL